MALVSNGDVTTEVVFNELLQCVNNRESNWDGLALRRREESMSPGGTVTSKLYDVGEVETVISEEVDGGCTVFRKNSNLR